MTGIYKLILLSILLFANSLAYAADAIYQGTIYLRDGRVIHALSINLDGLTTQATSPFVIHGQNYNLKSNSIASLDFLETTLNENHWIQYAKIQVTLKNGKNSIATHVILSSNTGIQYKDNFTGKVEAQTFDIRGSQNDSNNAADVIRIDFTGSGSLMRSPVTKKLFPPNFLYDPYNGTQLVPYTEGQEDSSMNAPEHNTVVANASEENSDTAANSSTQTDSANLTSAALEYAKTAINPLKSLEEASHASLNLQDAAKQALK